MNVEVKSVDAALDGHEGQPARVDNAATPPSKSADSSEAILQSRAAPHPDRTPPSTPKAPTVREGDPTHPRPPLEPPASARGTNSNPTPAPTTLARQREAMPHPTPRPHHRPPTLARHHKSVFSPEAIREYARELNYTARLVDFLRDKLDLRDRDPSEDHVRWIFIADGILDRSNLETHSPETNGLAERRYADLRRKPSAWPPLQPQIQLLVARNTSPTPLSKTSVHPRTAERKVEPLSRLLGWGRGQLQERVA